MTQMCQLLLAKKLMLNLNVLYKKSIFKIKADKLVPKTFGYSHHYSLGKTYAFKCSNVCANIKLMRLDPPPSKI